MWSSKLFCVISLFCSLSLCGSSSALSPIRDRPKLEGLEGCLARSSDSVTMFENRLDELRTSLSDLHRSSQSPSPASVLEIQAEIDRIQLRKNTAELEAQDLEEQVCKEEARKREYDRRRAEAREREECRRQEEARIREEVERRARVLACTARFNHFVPLPQVPHSAMRLSQQPARAFTTLGLLRKEEAAKDGFEDLGADSKGPKSTQGKNDDGDWFDSL